VPPKIRHDLWTPHCRVGPFPTAKQGQDALKKLQEFRRLNLYNWNKTNRKIVDTITEEDWADVQLTRHAVIDRKPILVMNWHKPGFLQKRKLIKLLMDYRANATADLARVLSIQHQLGEEMGSKRRERFQEQRKWLSEKWDKMKALTQALKDGKVKELDEKIAELNLKRAAAQEKAQPKEVSDIDDEIARIRKRIAEMYWASRMVQLLEKKQAAIDAEYDADMKVYNERKAELESQRGVAKQSKPGEAPQPAAEDQLQLPREPKKRANPFMKHILTEYLKAYPEGFSLKGVECQWSDLYDAEHATEHWPAEVVHDTLSLTSRKREHGFMTEEEYQHMFLTEKQEIQKKAEVELDKMMRERYPERYVEAPEEEEKAPEPAKGISKFMPAFIKNRFGSGQPRV
jgi:hypothetical protein